MTSILRSDKSHRLDLENRMNFLTCRTHQIVALWPSLLESQRRLEVFCEKRSPRCMRPKNSGSEALRSTIARSTKAGGEGRTGLAISAGKATQVPPALCDATTASPLNRSGRAYLRSSDQAGLDQPIGYQLFPMQVGSANRRKNGCDQSDCQGWRERQSSRR